MFYDVIVIEGSYAGMAAALLLVRARCRSTKPGCPPNGAMAGMQLHRSLACSDASV